METTYEGHVPENKNYSIANSLTGKQTANGAGIAFDDNRAGAVAQRKLQGVLNNRATVQKKENKTGLPDHLKSGIENLSGHSMDDVKVNYNSQKPAQLNAHAYAQGTDIHIAPGQEKHLPHEAWHVVQQKQNRVKPTMQMKGAVNINDNAGLEKEADVMGAKSILQKKAVVQRYPVEVDSTDSYIEATSGRPSKRTTKPVQEAIINDIFTYGAMNEYEKALHTLGKVQALYELRSNNWLSTNGAAVCHKNSIDDVENTLVHYGNMSDTQKASAFPQHKQWVEWLTSRDSTAKAMGVKFLEEIRDSTVNAGVFGSPLTLICNAINNLIELIDASSSNYYIGHGGTNSGIQSRPDPHYDNFATSNEAPSTPISKGLYDSRRDIESVGGLGHLSPIRAKDTSGDWVVNSGAGDINGKGWSQVDLGKGWIG